MERTRAWVVIAMVGALAGCNGTMGGDAPQSDAAARDDAGRRATGRDAGAASGEVDAGQITTAPGDDAGTVPSSDAGGASIDAGGASIDAGGASIDAGGASIDAGPGSPAIVCLDQCHYVRAGATGSGSGADWTNAYGALPAILMRGHVYFVAAGTYPGYTVDDAASGGRTITIVRATASNHGTDVGWPTSDTGPAVFTNTFSINTSDIIFDGSTGGGPGSWTSNFGFKIQTPSTPVPGIFIHDSVSNVVVRHFEVQGNDTPNGGGSRGNDGIDIALPAGTPATNVTVSHAYIHAMGRTLFWMRVDGLLVEYLYGGTFHSTAAQHAECVSSYPSRNVTFANNVFTHIEGTGCLMFDNAGYPAGNFQVYGNVFAPDATSAIANGVIGTWGGAGGEVVHGARIYGNTFIASPGPGPLIGFTNSNGTDGIDFRNNLIYNTHATGIANATSDYNHWVDSGGAHGEAHGSAAMGNPFRDAAALDFGLNAATPAGIDVGAPFNRDPLGAIRGADGIWDRGAYERSP